MHTADHECLGFVDVLLDVLPNVTLNVLLDILLDVLLGVLLDVVQDVPPDILDLGKTVHDIHRNLQELTTGSVPWATYREKRVSLRSPQPRSDGVNVRNTNFVWESCAPVSPNGWPDVRKFRPRLINPTNYPPKLVPDINYNYNVSNN